jgi:hypothetical protein
VSPRRLIPKRDTSTRSILPKRDSLLYDDLDRSVEQRAEIYDPDTRDFLLPYWYQYKDKMLKILKDNYTIVPRWVNYETFQHDMVIDMVTELFGQILANVNEDEIEINFSHTIGIALCSDYLDIGVSGIWGALNNLDIVMIVSLKGG